MNKDKSFEGPNWRGKGYFEWPELKQQNRIVNNSIWKACIIAVNDAKNGDFGAARDLVGWEEHATSDTSHFVWSELLGDIAPTTCFEKIESCLLKEEDMDLALDYCGAIYQRGLIGDVTLLLNAFLRLYMPEAKDNPDIIPDYIADLIGGDLPDFEDCESIDEYASYVSIRIEEIELGINSDKTSVWQGESLSIKVTAKTMIGYLNKGFMLQRHRQKFEAMTGINCSRFYIDQSLQILTATSVLEEFLDSDAVDNYKVGSRYFFGHRIPD